MSLHVVDAAQASAAEAGLDLLDRRGVTEAQMRDYLAEKGFHADAIADTVAVFAARGWLNDRDYATDLAQARVARAGTSRAKLGAAMEKRGLDPDAIAQAFAALDRKDPEWEYESAKNFLQGKAHQAARGCNLADSLEYRKLQAKLWRYLASRGFPFELSTRVVRETMEGLRLQ